MAHVTTTNCSGRSLCGVSTRMQAFRRAFTLVELLVVVAIIAVLMAVLLPSLAKAKKAAQAIKCVSMLKQMGFANMMFADDHAQHFVPLRMLKNWNGPGNPSGNTNWYGNGEYRKTLGALVTNGASSFAWDVKYLCPNSEVGVTKVAANGTVNPQYFYGYNMEDGAGSLGDNAPVRSDGMLQSKILHPGNKLMFADGMYDRLVMSRSSMYVDEYSNIGATGFDQYKIAYRHNTAANVVYFDGHATATPRALLDKDMNPNAGEIWKLPD